jgi:cation diffusion facilitator CzcD-associated flavoprotein CzcO
MPGFEARDFTKEEQQEFRNKPGKHVDFRKRIEHVSNQIFPLFLSESDAQKQAFQQYTARMRDSIDDEGLKEKLVPQWNVGCRRLTPGTNYLEGLFSDKSSVVYGEITHITEQGPATDDGHIHEVDVLVCATGFDTTFKPRFPLLGLEKTDLSVEWKKEPSAYLGVAAPKFPNYFMFLGPNCPIGNGPVLIGIEAQADYFMKFIHKMRQENIKQVTTSH